MKLIYCSNCADLVPLNYSKKKCGCGESFGNYLEDGKSAVFGGHAVPIGIANPDLQAAAKRFPRKSTAIRAWVDGPVEAETWKRVDS